MTLFICDHSGKRIACFGCEHATNHESIHCCGNRLDICNEKKTGEPLECRCVEAPEEDQKSPEGQEEKHGIR